MPFLIVGIGNPGPEYDTTRHNVGFEVVNQLASRLRADFEPDGKALVAWGRHKGHSVGLVKPQTYVNRSGRAVAHLMQAHDVTPGEVLVVLDDLNLETGRLRIRPKGSDGGHNGMRDVIDATGTQSIPRLRIGIGDDFGPGEQSDYVLSPFTPQQRDTIDDALIDASNAVLTFVREDLDAAMNQYNS